MSDLEMQNIANKPRNRRAVVKGAAWSVPVIAAAIAAPAASASVATAGLTWTGSETSLLSLRLLDGTAGIVNAKALITVPTEFTVTNGSGAISGNALVTITVGRPTGVNLPVGRARGFGVYSYDGVPTIAGERTAVYETFLGLPGGFPLTTYTSTKAFSVASNGVLNVPVEFGVAGVSDLLAISALASFPVTMTVDFGAGNVYSASTNISVPVGAGIL